MRATARNAHPQPRRLGRSSVMLDPVAEDATTITDFGRDTRGRDSAAIRAATTLRQAGTLLALIGAAGVVLWIWFQAQGQEEVGESLIRRKYTTALGEDDLTERLAVIAAMLPLLLQSALVATFGLACRAIAQYVLAREGVSRSDVDDDDDLEHEADAV